MDGGDFNGALLRQVLAEKMSQVMAGAAAATLGRVMRRAARGGIDAHAIAIAAPNGTKISQKAARRHAKKQRRDRATAAGTLALAARWAAALLDLHFPDGTDDKGTRQVLGALLWTAERAAHNCAAVVAMLWAIGWAEGREAPNDGGGLNKGALPDYCMEELAF